jgi:hypothetical protein
MIYKIRIILDIKENVFRDIEIKDKQNLWNLHLGIKNAFSLSGEDLSIFNILDQSGAITKSVPLEDLSDDGDGEIMSDVYINEAFGKTGDKLHFQYGSFDLWDFLCELVEISDEKNSVNYPITVFRFGTMPIKPISKSGDNKAAKKTDISFMEDDFETFDDDFNDFGEDDSDGFNDDENNFSDDRFDDEMY